MDITSDSILLKGLSSATLVEYLILSGWKQQPRSDWRVFQGSEDAFGEPLEIVLPRDDDAKDTRVYQASAVNLMSALQNEDPQTIIRRIRNYDSDVFTLLNVDDTSKESLSLERAVKQVSALKGLVGYSALSELDPKPHYSGYQTPKAHRMIDHYRFEHTRQGSFGFAISSRIVNPVSMYTQERMPFIDIPITTALPEERSVMERIIRGLRIAETAARNVDSQLIVREFISGFNSGMCRMTVKLKQDHFGPIECEILWSPKLKPSEDVAGVQKILISDRAQTFLREAAGILRQLKPETVTINGNVVGLLSRGNPFDDAPDIERQVLIRWTNRPEGRPVNVIVSIGKQDYEFALEAHRKWMLVQVTGIVAKVGNEWRMAAARNFGPI